MSDRPWLVLVIEDSFDDMQVMSTTLEYHGLEVMTASNADEFYGALQSALPDLVITDLAMPGLDGWDVLAALRNDASTQTVPVVAVTAYHSDRLHDEALQGGFDAYFQKPIDPQHFVEQLRTTLR